MIGGFLGLRADLSRYGNVVGDMPLAASLHAFTNCIADIPSAMQ